MSYKLLPSKYMVGTVLTLAIVGVAAIVYVIVGVFT